MESEEHPAIHKRQLFSESREGKLKHTQYFGLFAEQAGFQVNRPGSLGDFRLAS